MADFNQYQSPEPDQQFLQDVVAPPAAPAPAPVAAYNPGFGIGERNFETLNKNLGDPGTAFFPGWQGALDYETVKGLVQANPSLLNGQTLDDMFTYGQMVTGGNEEMGFQYGEGWSPTDAAGKWAKDNLSGYSLQRRGVEGLKDGRTNALYDPEGNLVYATSPYVYDPARDTLATALEMAGTAGAAFGLAGIPIFPGFTSGITSYLTPSLGATGANIATQALTQGFMGGVGSEVTGGSFGEGFGRGALTGAITGGISPYINQFGEYVSGAVGGGDLGKTLSGGLTGAVKSGIGALTTGTSVGDALLAGGLSGGVGAGVSALGGSYLSELPPSLRNAVTSAISAGVLGRNPTQAAINSFIGGLSTRTPEEQALYDAYQSPEGQASRDLDIYAPYATAGADAPGGFTSQWQTVGSDRVMIQDDGSLIGVNTETGQTYAMSPEEAQQMVDAGLLNTPESGYDAAISGTPVFAPPASGAAPQAPSAPAAQGGGSGDDGSDMAALLALLSLGAGGGDPPEEANAAQITTRSPYGNEIYGMRFGNV